MAKISSTTKRILASKVVSVKTRRAGSKVGEIVRKAGVQQTPELERIARLPRRNWQDLLKDDYVSVLSRYCLRPGSTGLLFDVQAAVLTEFVDYRGFLGNIGLGLGKTLVTALAPTLLGAENPVLIVPGKLRDKTKREFDVLRKDWLVHPRIQLISYEELSRNQDLLLEMQPDCCLCDEVHRFKNLDAACTKRMARFKKAYPRTPFMGLSGTVSNRTLRDVWHLMMWALYPERMPLPRSPHELNELCLAVDEKVKDGARIAPGALLDLFAKDIQLPAGPEYQNEHPDIVRARLGIQRRLQETAGYISTTKLSCNASIRLEIVRPPPSPIINKALAELRAKQEDVNGEGMLRPADIWAKARMYATGFVYRWDPPPPEAWRVARRNKDRLFRHCLNEYSNTLDTPLQVENAIRHNKITARFNVAEEGEDPIMVSPQEIVAAWKREEPLYTYKVVPEWIDLSRVQWIADRVLGSGLEVIVWVEHVAIGRMLSQISGYPFYHEGGYAEGPGKRFIDDARGPIIASVASNHEGRNLQRYASNFIVSAPPVGRIWEQLLGRTHRTGQEADEVEVFVLEACQEHAEGFQQVLADCRNVLHTQGTVQRMLLADIVNP